MVYHSLQSKFIQLMVFKSFVSLVLSPPSPVLHLLASHISLPSAPPRPLPVPSLVLSHFSLHRPPSLLSIH